MQKNDLYTENGNLGNISNPVSTTILKKKRLRFFVCCFSFVSNNPCKLF